MSPTTETIENNREIVRLLYEAFADGDFETLMAGLAPDAVWTEATGSPTGGTFTGPQEVRANVLDPISDLFASYTFRVDDLIAEGATVVARVHCVGAAKTGNRFEVPTVHVWTLMDGQVAAFQQYTDTRMVQEALLG